MVKRYFLLVFSVFLLTSCSASINTTSKVSYTKNTFTKETLRNGGLSILPITAGTGLEGYRRPFGDALNAYTDSLSGGLNYSGWQETLNEINNADLADDYNEAISNYKETSIIDKQVLQNMGETTGQRYFLYVQLGNFEQESSTNYNMFTGWQTTKTNEVSAYAQIWDAKNGDVVWEALSNAQASSSSAMVKVSDNPQKYSKKLAEGIANKLYVGSVDS